MNNYIINNIPSSNRNDFGYKSINSSATHNEKQEDMLNDILDLYNKTNLIEKTINEQMDYIKLENANLESIFYTLNEKYKLIFQRYESILNVSQDKRYVALPYECIVFDNENGAVIDSVANDITVRPAQKVSKFIIHDQITNGAFIPNGLNVTINNVNKNGIISSTDNDIYAPFYSDNNLYWTRKVVSDNTIESIETEYIIDLPEEIAVTPDVNEIFISPFLCKVKKVYGRFGDSNLWQPIIGQEHHDAIMGDNISDISKSVRPFRLNFPNTKINQIKIVLVSNSYTEGETNLRTFMYGIKQIGAYANYYNDYDDSTFQFDVLLKDHDGLMVTGVIPHFNNNVDNGRYSRDFTCDLYYKDNKGHYNKIIDTFPFMPITNELRVKCKFGGDIKEANIKSVELKYRSNLNLPPEISVKDIKQIDSKGNTVVALKGDGSVWTWGSNQYGQLTSYNNLGQWDKANTTPVRVNIDNVKEIAVGLDFTLALKHDGTVWSFGDNYYGQLGRADNIGTHEPNIMPKRIRTLSNVYKIAVGSWHSLALLTDGTVWTFGYNYYGQLGNDVGIQTHDHCYIPKRVEGISGVVGIDAGFWHSTAVTSSNSIYAWGYNESGQLGYDTDKEANHIPKLMNIF